MPSEWNATVAAALGRLRNSFVPFDLSPRSLSGLEALLLERYAPGSPPVPAGDDFLPTLIAYVGETAIRVTGGAWEFRDGVPFVMPDEILGLDPIEPLSLLIAAARVRTGKVLESAAERWCDAVADHPEFSAPPVTDPAKPVGGDRLAAWLTERERAFPRWLADYGGTGYDFSPGSLDLLQETLRQHAGRPERTELLAGAAWYFGEVIVRTKPAATWVSPGPDETDPDEHYVHDAGRDASTRPFLAVRLTTDPDDLVSLRQMFDMFR
jgi:hypothetical protein